MDRRPSPLLFDEKHGKNRSEIQWYFPTIERADFRQIPPDETSQIVMKTIFALHRSWIVKKEITPGFRAVGVGNFRANQTSVGVAPYHTMDRQNFFPIVLQFDFDGRLQYRKGRSVSNLSKVFRQYVTKGRLNPWAEHSLKAQPIEDSLQTGGFAGGIRRFHNVEADLQFKFGAEWA
ncbi:hypothetical protein CO655_15580 [Rhizobium sp. M1]|nr:hypothetical protein CO655_15580 [Rhizobium sp. M1]